MAVIAPLVGGRSHVEPAGVDEGAEAALHRQGADLVDRVSDLTEETPNVHFINIGSPMRGEGT